MRVVEEKHEELRAQDHFCCYSFLIMNRVCHILSVLNRISFRLPRAPHLLVFFFPGVNLGCSKEEQKTVRLAKK